MAAPVPLAEMPPDLTETTSEIGGIRDVDGTSLDQKDAAAPSGPRVDRTDMVDVESSDVTYVYLTFSTPIPAANTRSRAQGPPPKRRRRRRLT